MNKDESRFAELLRQQQYAGEILKFYYEQVKFRLAEKTFYTPDFLVVKLDHLEIVEVKGFLLDDAAVKFKCAAELYPWIKWKMIRWKNKQWETIYEF
jgi:hypothetical protein